MKIGDKVWIVWSHHRNNVVPQEATVTAIGRKWITINDRNRFEIGSMYLDGKGYASPGSVWSSPEEYHNSLSLNQAWSGIQTAVINAHRCPDGVTVERIEEARKLLGLDNKKVKP